jgi:hypothetical protein
MCQFAVRRQQEQAGGINVQAANRDPPGVAQGWKVIEDSGVVLTWT